MAIAISNNAPTANTIPSVIIIAAFWYIVGLKIIVTISA